MEKMRKMNSYLATGLAEGFEQGTKEEVIAAWQYLHDTGLAYQLQGWFGKTTQELIKNKIIKNKNHEYKSTN
jgi:hypothetical protein